MKDKLFSHVRDEKGVPFATIAFIVNESSKTFDVGISVCGPFDHFVKKIGREKALDRAKKGQTKFNVPLDKEEEIMCKLLHLIDMMNDHGYTCKGIELGQDMQCIYPWVGIAKIDTMFAFLFPRKVIFTEKDTAVVLDEQDFEGKKMKLPENDYKFLFNV